MPTQEEHDKPENLVEAPGEAERAARTLEDAVDSHHTLEGYFAMNDITNEKDIERLKKEAEEDLKKDEDREKGHPVP
jgi:hypothetical protein